MDIDTATIRRSGDDASLIAYGGTLRTTLIAAEQLATDNIGADVVDLPLPTQPYEQRHARHPSPAAQHPRPTVPQTCPRTQGSAQTPVATAVDWFQTADAAV